MKAELLPMITAKSPDSSREGSSSDVLTSSFPLDLPQHFTHSLWSTAQALSTDMNGMVNCIAQATTTPTYMGRVDRGDQLWGYYRCRTKS